jgi:hypothetical protein
MVKEGMVKEGKLGRFAKAKGSYGAIAAGLAWRAGICLGLGLPVLVACSPLAEGRDRPSGQATTMLQFINPQPVALASAMTSPLLFDTVSDFAEGVALVRLKSSLGYVRSRWQADYSSGRQQRDRGCRLRRRAGGSPGGGPLRDHLGAPAQYGLDHRIMR